MPDLLRSDLGKSLDEVYVFFCSGTRIKKMELEWWIAVGIATAMIIGSWYLVYRLGYRQGHRAATIASRLWLLEKLLEFKKKPDESQTT